jgi:hypothetical protein
MAFEEHVIAAGHSVPRGEIRQYQVKIVPKDPLTNDIYVESVGGQYILSELVNAQYIVHDLRPKYHGQMIFYRARGTQRVRTYVAVDLEDGNGPQWKLVKIFSQVIDTFTGLPWDPARYG